MPKQKTHSGAKKRFSLTAKKKVKFKRAFTRHILSKKSTKLKRTLRGTSIMAPQDAEHIKRLLAKK
jgi:large subunit ribosomal protein L35